MASDHGTVEILERSEPGPVAPPSRRQRVVAWLRRYQLVLAIPTALLVGLAVSWASAGGQAHGDGAPAGDGHDHAAGAEQSSVWTCSMHPQIQLPEAGKCPICGMDLIPSSAGGDDAPGPTEVVLSERAKALARIETAVVRRADTAVELRLLGRIEVDETKVRTVTPWVDGRIDRLFVSALGERIKRGQAVASMYSPEVYAAQADLLQARQQVDKLSKALPIAQRAAGAAYKSAQTRLKLLGLSSGEVGKMADAKSARRNVAVVSRYGGTVIEQLVHEGAYVEAGTPLYRIADLSTLWAQLDAYESDLARIAKEQKVLLTISSFPDETFEGKVAFVDPVVDARSRTARIRVEVPNDDGRLRPGMFADAVLQAPEGAQPTPPLAIPATAPLFTGTRSVVYVERPGTDRPTYEARQIQLGLRAGDVFPVVSGLKEGEQVVVQGAFVLDSDLQIRGGESMMARSDDVDRDARRPVRVNDQLMTSFAPLVDGYLGIQQALASDDFENAKQGFGKLVEQVELFAPSSPEEARQVWASLGRKLLAGARGGAHGATIGELRRSFDSVSEGLIEALQRFGNPLAEPLRLAYCPMAFDDRGALWLQRAEKIENAYFGAEMYRCGEIREAAAPQQRLSPQAGVLEPPKPVAATGHEHHGH